MQVSVRRKVRNRGGGGGGGQQRVGVNSHSSSLHGVKMILLTPEL